MEELAIDFDNLEVEEDDEDQSMEAAFERVSRGMLGSSRHGITDQAPFLDYSSFLAYAARYEIDMIPHGDLQKVAKLGSGATMAVFKGTCPTRWGDTEVAFKRLNLELPQTKSAAPLNSSELYQLLAAASLEVRVLSDSLLRFHPNIVDLLAVSWEELGREEEEEGLAKAESPRSVRPILIVELACPQHPTLDEYYNYSISRDVSIELDTKVSIISGVADALSAVHMCGVIHGDIKPHNILIFLEGTTIRAKISDFGGCQPPPDDNPSEYLSQFAVMGTEYWNAPEVYADDAGDWKLQSRLVTRDYFSMGLLAYYVLFEDLPFGDDGDNTDDNRARIAKLKKSPRGLVDLVHLKMKSRWTLAGRMGELDKLWKDTGFYERWEIFQRLHGEGKIFAVFKSGGSWKTVGNQEYRQYSLYFTMLQFLQRDPQARGKNELMRELRVFLNDEAAARSLRDVYLMQGMEVFISAYMEEGFRLADIRIAFGYQKEVTWQQKPPDKPFLSLIEGLNRRNEATYPYGFDHMTQIPSALRVTFLQELTKRASDPTDPLRVSSLLCLTYCRSQGYNVGGDPSRDFALEAARLGSIIGKQITLHWGLMQQKPPPIDDREESEWMLDVILGNMPSKNDFKRKVLDSFPDVTLVGNQLLRVFEEESCRARVIGKTFEVDVGDTDIGELFSAAISGQAVRLRGLLSGQHKDRLNMRLRGFNLLHAAAEYGQVAVLRLLIQKFGMDPDELNDDGVSAAALAVRADQENARSALLALGADYKTLLNIRTLRYLANYSSREAIRKIYLLAGLPTKYPEILKPFPLRAYLDGDLTALPETERDDGEPDLPPIFAAILGDNIGSLWTLLELGCSRDIHTKFSSGCLAPIHIAANLRPLHLALLLHYGALPDLRTKDNHQWTALHLACNARTVPKYKHPRVETEDLLPEDSPLRGLLGLQPEDYLDAKLCTIRFLVKVYGADVNAQDWVGSTAVSHCMSPEGDLAVARFLVEECDANIHINDFRGLSCLHRAVVGRAEPEYVKFCVEKGLGVNETDINGLTPLMMAAVTANVDISRALVNLGADLLTTEKRGRTCLDLAILGGHLKVFGYLFEVAEKRGILSAAVAIEDEFHRTLLHKIIQRGGDLVETFMRRVPGEAIAAALEKPDIVGFTLLHHAALAGNHHAAEFLLERRPDDANAKGWKRLTPLHIAHAAGNKKMIRILERGGGIIDQTATDLEGRTPADYGKLAAADANVFDEMVASVYEDCERRVPPRIDESAIVDENRRRGQPVGGWLRY